MISEKKSQAIAFKTIFSREVRRFLRIWPQTLLPSVITTSLYFVVFGTIIGKRIGSMGGVDYMQFVIPGLIMMSVITNSFSNVVSSFFGSKFQRSVEELIVAPVSNWIILAGYVTGGVVRGGIVGLCVMLISFLFVDVQFYNIIVTILAVILTSILFALGGFINAIYARKFDDTSIIPTFFLVPMTYLGGVFYSVNVLSEPWRSITLLNPIYYQINAFRYGVLGHGDGMNIGVAFFVMVCTIVLLTFWALRLLKKGKGLKQ